MVRIIRVCFLLAALIVVAAAAMFYTSLSHQHEVATRLYKINEIFDSVHRIREDYINAEKAAYRHATSGEDSNLAQREQLLTDVSAHIATLTEQLHDDVDQSFRLRQLAAAFTTLQLAPSGPLLISQTQNAPLVAWHQRRAFFDTISSILTSVLRDSESLDRSAHEYFRVALVQIASLIAISLLLLLAAYLFALRQVRTRLQAEALLKEKTLFQNAIFASARKAIITTDRQGIIQSFNVGAEQTLGYRADEVIGHLRPSQFHDAHERHERAQALSVELGAPVDPMFEVFTASLRGDVDDEQEWTYIRKDGSRLPVLLSVTALRTDQDEVIGYLGIAVDITKQKRTQAQLSQARADAEDATRVKAAFLATMSHEIRTPMNGVLGMVEVLAHSPLNEHQKEIVKVIGQSANILLRLIDDILDFSKMEAGRVELEKEPVCIRELAEGICSSLLPIATNKGVDLRVFISPEVPERVLADDVRVRQVLYNLVGNAIKFSGEQPTHRGRVQLRVEVVQASPLRIAFQVADNGIGIAQDVLEGLFSPFTQAEVSTTRRFGGTGLGLAICKRIIDLSEGDIQVESALGKGATFTVTLPFEQAAAPLHSDMPNLTGINCIVVESMLINCADLIAYLAPQGTNISSAVDLNQAASLISKMPNAAEVVVIYDDGDQNAFKQTGQVGQLLLTQSGKRKARVRSKGVVSIDVDAMSRHSFVRAVAVAAGRLSPAPDSRAEQGEPAISARRLSIAEARAQGRLILIAEDDAINQKVILHQLDQLGYAAEIAGTGAEALKMWRAGQYALLITDLNMPELDGCGLTSAIRAEEATGSHLPILALSANAVRGEAAHVLCCGIDDYLTKPAALKVLQKALETWMPPNDNFTPANTIADEKPATANAAAVEVGVLKTLLGDDDTMVHELLFEFQAVSQRQATELHHAYEAGDTALISATAHKLKSSSRSIGASQLADACVELENASKKNDQDAVRLAMQRFDTSLAAVANALNCLLAKGPSHE